MISFGVLLRKDHHLALFSLNNTGAVPTVLSLLGLRPYGPYGTVWSTSLPLCIAAKREARIGQHSLEVCNRQMNDHFVPLSLKVPPEHLAAEISIHWSDISLNNV